jgi:hypothetical protein
MTTKPLLARCVRATEHLPAAMILYRMAYWHPRTKVERDGKRWVVKGHQAWMEETSLSQEQIKDGLAKLRALHLIETERHLFGSKISLFQRLTPRAELFLKDEQEGQTAPMQESHMAPMQEGQMAPTDQGHMDPIYVQGDKTGSLDKEFNHSSELAFASPDPEIQSSISEKEEEDMGKTAHEVLAELSAKKALGKITAVSKPKQLEHWWCATVNEHYGVFVAPFTVKQLGQVKQLIDKLPADKLLPTIEHCLANWVGFCEIAMKNAGTKGFPAMPNIDYMVKHLSSAMEYAGPAAHSGVIKAPQPKAPSKSVQTKPVVTPANKGMPVSLADILSEPTE